MKNNFTDQSVAQTLEENYMPYAMSVIISRAIPEIDGLKPSHRKLLYTMYKMSLLNGARTKSANVVGQTMKLNPHGDQAIYDTLVRLSTGNGALLHPLIDSKGNFGKQYSRDMAAAASRYTEVKLAPICAELFGDIDKDTVEIIPNYDGTLTEPQLLPARFPSILVNANQGIAVGMASNICSFNLKEVCDTTIAYLKNPNCKLEKTLLAPDFSTGGEILYDKQELDKIYETGRGSVKVRSKYTYDKKSNCIEITEIPYSTTVEAIMEKIIDLVKQGKVREINDLRDETDLSGMKITIDLKRGIDPDKLMAKLFKITPLQDSFGCNFNVLIGNTPMTLGVRGLLEEWCKFRIDCVKRALQFDINKKSERLHLLEGLEKILLDIDKAIRIIRETEQESQVIPNLMDGFSIDQVQAEFIAEIRLRNLNKEYILKRTQDIESLIDEIAELKAIYSDDGRVRDYISNELKDISKKYGQPRRSSIITEVEEMEVEEETYIEDFPLKLFLTRDGYLKKVSHASLRASANQKLKEGDIMMQEIDTTNKTEILVFSDRCVCYKLRTYEFSDCKASQLGEYLPAYLGMEDGERVAGMAVTADYKGNMLFCFANGKMAKVPVASYETKTNRKKLANAYSGASPLVKLVHLKQECDMAAISTIDKVLVFNTEAVSLKSTRDSQGVAVMTLKKKATLKDVRPAEEMGLQNPAYYKTKNIPAVGCFLKEEDSNAVQTTLF